MSDLIEYGFSECPFGDIIVARTREGVCDLQFLDFNRLETIHELAKRWGKYTPTTQDDTMAHTVERVAFEHYDHPLRLDLRARPSRYAFGKPCGRYPSARHVPTSRWPRPSESRRPCAP